MLEASEKQAAQAVDISGLSRLCQSIEKDSGDAERPTGTARPPGIDVCRPEVAGTPKAQTGVQMTSCNPLKNLARIRGRSSGSLDD
jgi:hypothetical protein